MNNPLVTINLVVYNGERYIRHCLRAVKQQTYSHLEVNIFDNASTDSTREIVQKEFPEFNLIAHATNLGMWPGQEAALQYSHGQHIIALSVDVILEPHFVERSVATLERDPAIGALQAKIYRYNYHQLIENSYTTSKIIDTCGFILYRSRKVGNIGHGQEDDGRFDQPGEIFAVEGAVPVFRRDALEKVRIDGQIIDHEYFWYGDDLDLTWRMRLFGFKQWYDPTVIAYHDRSTTKSTSSIPIIGQLGRLGTRHQIPLKKRQLDWSNVRFTILKNDYIINILKDLPFILLREIEVLGYTLLFEPAVFGAIPGFLRRIPSMLRKRKQVMARAVATPGHIHQWIR